MDCPSIAELGYSVWHEAFEQKMAGKRIPVSGSIELTYRCNNRCVHCYCNQAEDDLQERSKELTTRELFGIIDTIVDAGCLWLLLTGGEILLREDFREIYLHAKKKGLLVTLFTNGTLINEGLADLLAEWRPFSVEITIYGASEAIYEKVTRRGGAYKQCMKGIDLLVDRKLPVQLKTCLITMNAHELQDMKALAASLGIFLRFDPLINFRLDQDRSPADFRLSPEEIVKADLLDGEEKKEWTRLSLQAPPRNQSGWIYTCRGGESSCNIDPYGNLSPCIIVKNKAVNLKEKDFHTAWEDMGKMMQAMTYPPDSPCKSCNLINLCGRCPGWSLLEHGNEENPVAYLCRVARLRREHLGATTT
jgi:radical SAM protein with 4Fe4S-binding SPASM domain